MQEGLESNWAPIEFRSVLCRMGARLSVHQSRQHLIGPLFAGLLLGALQLAGSMTSVLPLGTRPLQ